MDRLPLPPDCEKLILFYMPFKPFIKFYYMNAHYKKLFMQADFWLDKCRYEIAEHQRSPNDVKHFFDDTKVKTIKDLISLYRDVLLIFDVIDPDLKLPNTDILSNFHQDRLSFYYRYPVIDPKRIHYWDAVGTWVKTRKSLDNITYLNDLVKRVDPFTFFSFWAKNPELSINSYLEIYPTNDSRRLFIQGIPQLMQQLKTDPASINMNALSEQNKILFKILTYTFNPEYFNKTCTHDIIDLIIAGKPINKLTDGYVNSLDLLMFIISLDDPDRYERYTSFGYVSLSVIDQLNLHTFESSKIWNFIVDDIIKSGIVNPSQFSSYYMFWKLLQRLPSAPALYYNLDMTQRKIWNLVFPNTPCFLLSPEYHCSDEDWESESEDDSSCGDNT